MAQRKLKEKNYDYWQHQFDGHSSYMLGAENNEYAILRNIILGFIDDNESLLEVGCASGGMWDWIKVKGRNLDIVYQGTDYAEKFIKANRKRHPEVKWAVVDARSLKGFTSFWDTVLLYDVLDGMEGWEQALDEAIRVAKKRVIVLMWCDADMGGKLKYMEEKGLSVTEMDVQGNVHYHKVLVGFKQ